MILSPRNTLLEDLAAARTEGFTEDFMFSKGALVSRESKKRYTQADCVLVEYCRHEGMSNPSDSSILFLISCTDGKKGCLSSAYGKDADGDLIDFVMGLKRE